MGTTLQSLPITIPIALSFSLLFWIKFKCFCEWWDSNSLRIAKTPKKLNYGNNSPTTTHPSPYHFHYYFENQIQIFPSIALSFSLLFWIKFKYFCKWWDSNSQPLSRAYPPLPLHYYINYVYISFSFHMYYNKSRTIWLFEILNEFIWKCDQL
jgi:hypothetical protein